MKHKNNIVSHEAYIRAIKDIIAAHASQEDRTKLDHIKLVYGAGHVAGARGVTIYNKWSHGKDHNTDIVEVCALGEENHVQLAGTTLHELAHVLAGHKAGHSSDWKKVCDMLGLRKAMAAGMTYHLANFAPWLRFALVALEKPNDGKPNTGIDIAGMLGGTFKTQTFRGCTLGYGTRGGTSRGVGSGSRLRLWICECGTKIRAASDTLDVTCNVCKTTFKKVEKESR